MSGLPPFEGRFPSDGVITSQVGDVLDLTFYAERKGIVDSPAAALEDLDIFGDAAGGELSRLNAARFNVAARQLWLLGYFRDKPRKNISPQKQETARFRQVVKQFQREAGLTVDGWIGVETWHALQALVSFETKTDRSRWLTPAGDPTTALQRALSLRMWAFGLIDSKPKPTFKPVPEDDMQQVGNLLHELTQQHDTHWQDLLMGDEVILAAILAQLESQDGTMDHPALRRLIVNTAKIELWLLGLNVEINGEDDYPVNNFTNKTRRVKRNGRYIYVNVKSRAFETALTAYWHNILGEDEDAAKSKSQMLTAEFFDSLLHPEEYTHDEKETVTDEDYSQQVTAYFESRGDTNSAIDAAFSTIKKIGMKIWDGIKRLWRWLKRGVQKIVNLAENMTRGFFRFATKGFHILKTSLKTMWAALRQYSRGRLDATDAVHVAIKKDGDFQVLISTDARREEVVATQSAITRFSRAFYFSCRLIGLVINLLKAAVSGAVGWARFLLTLVKHYRTLVPIYRQLQQYA